MKPADHKGTRRKEGEHLRLYRWFTDSLAWRDLSTESQSLYLLLKEAYRGNNNGRLVLSIRQAADRMHVSKSSASRAFTELVEHGFAEMVVKGSFNSRKDGRATEWRLTEHPCDVTKELASKAFMRWRPKHVFTVPPEGRSVPLLGHSVPPEGLSKRKTA